MERLKLIVLGFWQHRQPAQQHGEDRCLQEAVTFLAGRMQQLPGFWLVPIRQNIPIWLCASVSCTAK